MLPGRSSIIRIMARAMATASNVRPFRPGSRGEQRCFMQADEAATVNHEVTEPPCGSCQSDALGLRNLLILNSRRGI